VDKLKVDESLQTFFATLANMALQVLLVLTVAATFGIEITTFAAIVGAASLAVAWPSKAVWPTSPVVF